MSTCPIDRPAVTLSTFAEVREAMRAKDLRQALYDDGALVMADCLLDLHGSAHRDRRRLENRLFRRETFEEYETDLLPRAIAEALDKPVDTAVADALMRVNSWEQRLDDLLALVFPPLLPLADEVPPALEAVVPPVDDAPPVLEAVVPSVEEVPPMLEAVVPSVEEVPPMLEAAVPPVEELRPSLTDMPAPPVEELRPSLTDMPVPPVEELRPSLTDMPAPPAEELRPSLGDWPDAHSP
jgi:hypothetical protein